MDVKQCWACKQDKILDEFYADKKRSDGKQGMCKDCAREYNQRYGKERRESKKEWLKDYRRSYRLSHIEQVLITAARVRAREDGVPIDLEESDIIVPNTCPVLGIPILLENVKLKDSSPTLDRLNPEKGYVKGNVSVISYRANRIKNYGTAEEHRKVSRWMEEITKNTSSIFNSLNPNPSRYIMSMVTVARGRSKKFGVPLDIEPRDITIPEFCPILGIKLERGSRKDHENSPSLDRILPDLGYVKGNVAVISWRANCLKNNGTAEEHLKIANWMDSVLQYKQIEEESE